MPRRAYSYKRVSQWKFGGDSFARQDDFAEMISKEEGWHLDDTLRFVDKSKSGFHGANLAADLGRFLDLVERGVITPGSVLILENIDRLSRQDVDIAHDLFRSLIRAGIWIATQTPRRVYNKESNSLMDLMEPLWLMYLAHQESLKKSVRATHSWQTIRKGARGEGKAPHSGRGPLWLRKVAAGWEEIPERVAEVRLIGDLIIGGMGTGEVAAWLTDHGMFGLTRKKAWAGSSVWQLITSRALLGEYQPHRREVRELDGGGHKLVRVPEGSPIVGYYPAVFDEPEWLAIRQSMNTRKGKSGRPALAGVNLFTGLVVDVASGRKMSLQNASTHGKRIPYLSIGQFAGCVRVRYDDFELATLQTLGVLRPEDVLEPCDRQDARERLIGELTARQTALMHRQGQLQASLADPDQDAASLLPVLAAVSADLKATAAARNAAQLEARSGRAEALAYAQTLGELRVDPAITGEAREDLDRRIKAALPSVIREIEVRVKKISPRRQEVTVRIILHSGIYREVTIQPESTAAARTPPGNASRQP